MHLNVSGFTCVCVFIYKHLFSRTVVKPQPTLPLLLPCTSVCVSRLQLPNRDNDLVADTETHKQKCLSAHNPRASDASAGSDPPEPLMCAK